MGFNGADSGKPDPGRMARVVDAFIERIEGVADRGGRLYVRRPGTDEDVAVTPTSGASIRRAVPGSFAPCDRDAGQSLSPNVTIELPEITVMYCRPFTS